MNSNSNPKGDGKKAWLTPTRLSLAGLATGIGLIAAVAICGIEAKQPFWILILLLLIIGLTTLSVLVIGWALSQALRHRNSGILPTCLVAVGMLCIAWGIAYPTRQSAIREIASVNEIYGFTDALLSYIEKHNSKFPDSLDDLIEDGIIQKTSNGRWFVSCRQGGNTCTLRDPTWFDVAWGISSDQVDVNGLVKEKNRLVVRPASNVHALGFELVCQSISIAIGRHLAEKANINNQLSRRQEGSVRSRPTVEQLVNMSDAELAKLDIAEVNLICASGLPGAENLDIDHYLTVLDIWAEHARREIDRNRYQFLQNPAEFENSEAYYNLLLMTTALQLDCGVKYNPEAIREVDFSDPRDQFIHGIIDGHGGTCASIPVLYVAIGRRLGYPLKLSTAISHVFTRWDDPFTGERINFEAAGNGMATYPDDHYMIWPRKMSKEQIKSGDFLASLSPRQELAHFLGCRGHCHLEHKQWRDAEFTYFQAHDLCPTSEVFQSFLLNYVTIRDEQGFKPPTEKSNTSPES